MIITKNSFKLLISCLEELSDLEFQKRVWLRGEGPEESSFVELTCQLFDDTGLDDLLSNKGQCVIFSKDIDLLLCELSKIIDTIDSNDKTINILNYKKVTQKRH